MVEMLSQDPKLLIEKQTVFERSFESAATDEKEDPHYNYESDGEPPTDQAGDLL